MFHSPVPSSRSVGWGMDRGVALIWGVSATETRIKCSLDGVDLGLKGSARGEKS